MATKIDLDGKSRDAPKLSRRIGTETTVIYAAAGFLAGVLITWLAWSCRLLGNHGIVATCATGGVLVAIIVALVGPALVAMRR